MTIKTASSGKLFIIMVVVVKEREKEDSVEVAKFCAGEI